ncbi:aminomethyl-transferring glycine dehydrogenase subunit GcvPB [Helicovermis profundi]|uniref:Probable glycine dehydrogenase (decarboxylating) subunit 2 n=1 Tax=Helicovermis profundi TaxID=3065157 RepID=A0AAU9EC08_9FIRM|nr:aminomethyl-transferring glycine dehydrogenase subunit GcvPB [Clostridia bacterium S502]
MRNYDSLIFEISKPGRKAYSLPKLDVEDINVEDYISSDFLRKEDLAFPEVSEVDVIRHYTNLSQLNYGLDTGFYPLGSCTMKYNPRINEDAAGMTSLNHLHPYQPVETVQGSLKMMYKVDEMLREISGMDRVTLQPAAGAHGELTGIMLIKAYHRDRGDLKRTKIIVPDSAHGTNPSTSAVAGFDIVEIKSNADGSVNMDSLKEALSDEIAGFMLTNPSTLGLFEKNIVEIAELIHEAGGLLYYDGANMNAIMGKTRPGDMGFDVMHFNLHKTFSTPHGGGGPGSGPVGVKEFLVKYLPVPVIDKKDDKYILDYDRPKTIGKVKGFYGNYSVILRAFTYLETMGSDGINEVSELAVLNANYMMNKLKENYKLPMDQICKHEFVLDGVKNGDLIVSTLDVAKRLLDFGYHPPTIYFPLIVHEAIMIEPTETESKETMDAFINVMNKISDEVKEDPSILKNAPTLASVRRIDEAKAARSLILKYSDNFK